MELQDLVGLHDLSGIEIGKMVLKAVYYGEQRCNFVKFTIDGVHYLAVEDPDDGYRSFCRDLTTSDEAPRFSFPPKAVKCYMECSDDCCHNDILIVENRVTGETILEIGTEDIDEDCPCFHLVCNPKGIWFVS